MKAAQRIMGIALVAAASACASNGGLGGLGNILGGVLGQPMQTSGTVQGVDARSQVISLSQSGGGTIGVSYDNRTRVIYNNQLYAPTSLEYGDQIVARLQDNGNGSYYSDSIYVTSAVNNGSNRGVYGSTAPSNTNAVQSLQGTVRQIDRSAGWFTVDGGNGQLTVTLPYRANSADVNRFNNLRTGDYVRFAGVWVSNSRIELRQFY